ncbi:fasciclin domain-containing protein [Dyadobacter jiangsuensis]
MVTNSIKLHFALVLRKLTTWKAMKKNRFGGRWATFFLAAGLFSTILISCKENADDVVKNRAATDIILENPEFSILKEIMLAAKKGDAFRTQNATFFLPTNAAFNKAKIFSASVITSKPDSIDKFLNRHVLNGQKAYSEFTAGKYDNIDKTLKIEIVKKDTAITVNGSHISRKDLSASNGIIQVLDSVYVKVLP